MYLSSEINERLNALVKHFTKGNVAAFARSINVSQQRFDRLLKPDKKKGKFPDLNSNMIETILTNYPSINKVWFLSGHGDMLKSTLNDSPRPFVSASQGVPYFAVDFVHEYELINNKHADSILCYFDVKMFNQADFWCNVSGHAMEPYIAPDDIVAMKEVIGKVEGVVYGDIYGIVTNNFCIVRRVAKGNRPNHLKLIPSNKSVEYAEQEISYASIERIYQIISVIKKL